MANNFRTIYLYIVALITLCMIVGGIVSTVNYITSYFYPDSYVFYENIDETDSLKYDTSYNNNDFENTQNNLIERENYKKETIKNAVVSVAVIIVGTLMYIYHWNLIEKERIK